MVNIARSLSFVISDFLKVMTEPSRNRAVNVSRSPKMSDMGSSAEMIHGSGLAHAVAADLGASMTAIVLEVPSVISLNCFGGPLPSQRDPSLPSHRVFDQRRSNRRQTREYLYFWLHVPAAASDCGAIAAGDDA